MLKNGVRFVSALVLASDGSGYLFEEEGHTSCSGFSA